MVLKTNIWVEIAVMYDVLKGRARIYVDGELKQEELSDPMRLSQDWSIFAGAYLLMVYMMSSKL